MANNEQKNMNERQIKTKEESKKIKEKKMLIPKIDIVFQSLFSKNNPEITKAFAETLIEEKIKKMKINEDKELVREKPNDKLGVNDKIRMYKND